MDIKTLTFEEWLPLFKQEVARLGYRGSVNEDHIYWADFTDGKSPDVAASDFIIEMTD